MQLGLALVKAHAAAGRGVGKLFFARKRNVGWTGRRPANFWAVARVTTLASTWRPPRKLAPAVRSRLRGAAME